MTAAGDKREPGGISPVRMGDRVGHYEIIGEIGRGGMGVVYRARDLTLGRDVALKCPWPDLAIDPESRRRFLHEGRAASQISHPNVIQVFEAFEHGGLPWIALQLVDGRDLDALLSAEGRLPIDTIIRYGQDILSALKAAHDRNTLHRDIKPRNVLITSEGRALLGDFGLARMLPQAEPSQTGPTESVSLTPAGVIMGTPRFMSPEQVLGRPLDKRSDIFSLGTVLYEMAAGSAAFSPSAQGSLFDAIIHREPPSLSRLNHDVPEELERIIYKAMAKPPEERYQDASEFLADLSALRRRREFKEYSEAHPVRSDLRRRPLRLRIMWLVPAIVLIAWAASRLTPWPAKRSTPEARPAQVTSTDAWESQPSLSPDGGRLAYASDEGGNFDVFVVDVHGGTPLNLTSDPAADAFPVWFPDGSTLAFVSDRDGEPSIWKVGQLGGGATLLVGDAGQPAISPDGDRIAFSRATPDHATRIGVAPLDGSSPPQILTGDQGGIWDHEHPAWSPDGRSICYSTRHGLWIIPASGGTARRLTGGADLDRDPSWSPSGRYIYFSSYREGTFALWRVRPSGGTPERITMGTGCECQPTVSRDGSRLAYATQIVSRNLIIRDLKTSRETPLRGLPDAYQAAFSPNQEMLVFVAPDAKGRLALWLQPLREGTPAGPPRQLTDQPGDASHPVFSPDGRWIAYYRIIGEERDIWVVGARGGEAIRFTDSPAPDLHPAWSPDGSEIAFASERAGESHLWITPFREGLPAGEARRAAEEPVLALAPVWAPGGGELAFVGSGPSGNEAWIVPLDARGPARQVTSEANVSRVRWDPAGRGLIVCGTWGGHRFTLRRIAPDGAPLDSSDLSFDLGSEAAIPIFDVSADGRRIVHIREEMRGDIWLLEARRGSY